MARPLSPQPWPRRTLPLLAPGLYLALLLVLCGVLVWRPLDGYLDFWAHAAIGRWVCEHGAVPRRTLFLWTADVPWVYHSWLSQVVFYGLTRLGGEKDLPYVVLGFVFVMVVLSLLPAWALWARRGRLSAWVIVPFYLYLGASFPRFQPRPELFTMAFLAAELLLLTAWSARPADQLGRADLLTAAALLPLFAVWANFHGGVMAGLILLGTAAACDLVQDRFRRRSLALALLTPAAFLAVAVNPYGFGYWQAFLPLNTQVFAHLGEWQPLWKLSDVPTDLVAQEAALAALALLAWATNPARRWFHLAWLVVAAGLFASAVRNSWLLALVSLMTLAANAGNLDPVLLWEALGKRLARRADRPPPPPPAYMRWLFRAAIVVWLCLQTFVWWSDIPLMASLTPDRLSEGAVRFVREQGLTGHGFNDPENGSYLQWRFGGEPPLFIDNLDAYTNEVLHDYVGAVNLDDYGRALLDGDRLDWILLTTNRPGPSFARLGKYLDRSPHWMRVYAGGDGVIWVRRTPEAERRWQPQAGSVIQTDFGMLETVNADVMMR